MTTATYLSEMSERLDEEKLHLGYQVPKGEEHEASPVQVKPKTLLRHMMALGSSGSGKTVLSKVVVEEMTRLGLPAICIDPQGDLCSLALALEAGDVEALEARGVSSELAASFREMVEVVIFTPASRKGVPICADPLQIDVNRLEERERIEAVSNMATMITSLIGFDLGSDDGEGIRAAFDTYLNVLLESGTFPKSLEQFGARLQAIEPDVQKQLERFVNGKKLEQALRKLARLDVGARRLLFHEGLALNIDLLLGHGERSAKQDGKVRLSVIYLNTLNSSEDKEFLIAAVAEQLYAWMLRNPSKDPQALFYIDEVAPFIPPVKVPACKPSLSLIFKQARKYGVCCLMATQNPGDVDYKAMAQFGTWAIGRLTTRQDLKKIQPTLKSLDPDRADDIIKLLPTLQAGEFMLISPDAFDETIELKTRWLYSEHETLDDRKIQDLCDERWRQRFLALERELEGSADELKADSVSEHSVMDNENAKHSRSKTRSTGKGKSAENSAQSETQQESNEDELEEIGPISESQGEVSESIEDLLMELFESGEVLNLTDTIASLDHSKASVNRALKTLVDSGKVSTFKRGRSKLYYDPSGGARPDLDLDAKVFALIPKLSREAMDARIESNRQKSFLGFFGKDEDLESKRLIYHVVYQVLFQEQVERSGFSAFFGDKHESVEDSVYLDPESLKVFVYEPNKNIQLLDEVGHIASDIPDFDGVSDLTEFAPGSVKFDEDSWQRRQDEDAVRRSIERRFKKLKILGVRPVFLPVWQLRYQERGGHQVRIVYIDGLTGQTVNLHG